MKILLEKEAEDLLEKEGFDVVKRDCIKEKSCLSKIKINYPLAMKVISKKAVHKAKVGGVILNIKNLEEAENAFEKMKKIEGFEGVVIQKMTFGEFVILGLKRTPEFGLVLMFGAGGGKVEEKKDITFRVCPVNEKDADDMIKEVKIYNKLKDKKINLELIKKNLLKTSHLSEKYKDIEELDINPLIAGKNNAVVVDARIVIGKV